jgi:hypothetical protein
MIVVANAAVGHGPVVVIANPTAAAMIVPTRQDQSPRHLLLQQPPNLLRNSFPSFRI